jgi:hypothetical protein
MGPLLFKHFIGPWVNLGTQRFSNKIFYFLPKQCIYVFCTDLRTNSDYFPN